MPRDFCQTVWDQQLAASCRELTRMAVSEDLGAGGIDWTTAALIPDDAQGRAAVVARKPGIAAGILAVTVIVAEVDSRLAWSPALADGDALAPGQTLGVLSGPAGSLLQAERIVLNFVGHLCGIATLTGQYVQRIRGSKARIYDTRKTTPGYRLLEKYAVRCGGGMNHRGSLSEAVLIKDNHLALGATTGVAGRRFTPAEAVRHAREFLRRRAAAASDAETIVEVEVDTLQQLEQVLPADPDIVLLDNMSIEQLLAAVERRNALNRRVELEASGGVNLETVAAIAATGVDRISVGAVTHSAVALDIGLDWLAG